MRETHDMADTTQPGASPTERRIRRLITHRPGEFRPGKRIDWIHDADLGQLLEPKEHRR